MSDVAEQPDPTPRPTLAGDLAALYGAPVQVPEAVDRAVIDEARTYLATRAPRRLRVTRWWIGVGGAAAAAVIAVAVVMNRPAREARQVAAVQGPPASAATSALAGDINGDGRIDVLDALVLSHRIQANQQSATSGALSASPSASSSASSSSTSSPDVNHDGVVDARDVDAIALAAVRLPQGDLR